MASNSASPSTVVDGVDAQLTAAKSIPLPVQTSFTAGSPVSPQVTSATPLSPNPTHDDTLSDVLQNNKDWAKLQRDTNPGLFEKLEKKQAPEILWIGCSDARVPAENICGLGPGDLFVHRNIANVVVHTDLSMLSVLQYAVDILKVKHIVVCGHYNCGGCASAMSNRQYGLIDNWLRNIKDIYSANETQMNTLPNNAERLDVLVELNVAKSIHNLSHTTIVQNAWARGQSISLHGWVYRLSDGILEDLQLCINHKDEANSIYTYVTSTGIHTAPRRGTSLQSTGIHTPLHPQTSLAAICASPPSLRTSKVVQEPIKEAVTPTQVASRLKELDLGH